MQSVAGIRTAVRLLSIACVLAASAGVAKAVPTLAIDTPFAVRGGQVSFTVTGEPGATALVLLSLQPAELPLGAPGTFFLKPGTSFTVGGAVIGAQGTATSPLAIPGTTPAGTVFYVQALTINAAQQTLLSNAVPFRVVDAAPAGRRATLAVAATPDGTKAYVAHLADGSVSVIDAVNDAKLTELPVTPPTDRIPHRALDIGIDPEGRHAFVVNTTAASIAVVHVATDSIAAQIPTARGNRRIGFDFSQTKRIYVTNEVRNAVLVFDEVPNGAFVQRPEIPIEGNAPGPLLVLPDGRLVVGLRASKEIVVIDPAAAPGSQTVARTPIAGVPFDLVLRDSEILIPTFVPITGDPLRQGLNRVLRVSLADFQVTGFLYESVGTDYVDVALAGSRMAVIAASSGTVIVGDRASGAQLDNIELAPTQPTATPQDAAFLPTPAGPGVSPEKLYVANYFRETVRVIDLTAGPPFALGVEIPLAWSGQPRVPRSGDLTPAEDGDWFFRSVNLFGAGAFNPNNQTCFSCHVDGASDNVGSVRQAPAMWNLPDTGPYGWNGNFPNLTTLVAGAINRHKSGGTTPPGIGTDLVMAFLDEFASPVSIHRLPNGNFTPDALAGKALFEGVAQCTLCHSGPLFIPPPPVPLTFPNGIGTGIAPINVPSLNGAWVTAPYLHDGSAATLLDVLTKNPADVHGFLAAPLSDEERRQLVEYVKSL